MLSDAQFFQFAWRIPFLASALLVGVGLFVRLKISETPAFQKVLEKNERVKVTVVPVLREHRLMLVMRTAMALATFLLFYLMTVFALTCSSARWATAACSSCSCSCLRCCSLRSPYRCRRCWPTATAGAPR